MNAKRITVIALAILVLAGCSKAPTWTAPSASSPSPTKAPEARLASPVSGATGVPVSTELELTPGTADVVELRDAAGRPVAGTLRVDRSSWVPAEPLAHSTTYTATVGSGQTTFTTMASPRSRQGSGLYLFDGQTYGTAMPIYVEFPAGDGGGIPEEARSAVEKRLFVVSDPPQVGAWHWDSHQAVEYRPRELWKPGTKISVRVGFGGLPLGNGKFGDTDRAANITIADRTMVFTSDNETKTMTVTRNGEQVQSFPISLGKPSTPSSSGNMVIMSRERTSRFISRTPGDSYDTVVSYAERLTWGGEYIHAAPWSVGDQGSRNVSHGCVNLSTENAAWIYDNSLIGDLVVIRGTEVKLQQGNGWTVWDLTWDEVLAGSSLQN